MRMHDAGGAADDRRCRPRQRHSGHRDEIFAGFGRTGTMFAFEQAGFVPDIATVSKALTGGTLPLARTVASEEIVSAFRSDDADAALLHGPTCMFPQWRR